MRFTFAAWRRPRHCGHRAPRAGHRPSLVLEPLETRTVLSQFDGSFDVVGLTALRNDPHFSVVDGHGVGIAIIDEGLYAAHPDLRPNFVHWFDAVTGQDSSYTDVNADVAAAFDPEGHGSHVAGIAAASDPRIGVAPKASLIGIRGLPAANEQLPVNEDPVANALQWVADHAQQFNIKVVNMSLGNYETNVNSPLPRTSGEAALVAQLESLGVTVVSASGNNYAQFIAPGAETPAAYSTISVANTWSVAQQFASAVASGASYDVPYWAVERDSAIDRLAATSQRSSLANQVAAPGQDIYSTWNGAGGRLFNTISGTSMAAPLVSGAVALMQQAAETFGGRYLSPAEIVSLMESTADTITDNTVSSEGRVPVVNGQVLFNQETALPATGLSLHRINVYRAIQAVQQLVSGVSQTGDTNNTLSTATVMANLDGTRSFTTQGNIGLDGLVRAGVNDVDLYKVVLESPGTLALQMATVSGGVTFDPYLRLFDSSGIQIGSDHGSGANGYPALTTGQLTPGTYFIGVSAFANTQYNVLTGGGSGGNSQGDYALTVSLSNPDPNGVIQGAVPFAGLPILFPGIIGSDPLPINSSTRIQVGPGDVDMFQVLAPDDGNLLVDVNVSKYGFQALDSYARVFDAQGNEIAHADSGGLSDLSFSVPVARGQTVYVGVSDAANTTYDPNSPFFRSALGFGGLYDLTLGFDNGDQNGTVQTAVTGTIGQTRNGIIGSDPLANGGRVTVGQDGSKDVDFFSFTPTSAGLLDAVATGTNGFIPSLSIWTLDSSGQNVIRVGDTANAAAELIYPVQANETYYLAVTGLGNNDFLWYSPGSGTGGQTGSYSLLTSLRPMADLSSLSNNQVQGHSAAIQDITLGQRINGNIGQDGNLIVGPTDVDLYRFVAASTGVVNIQTDTSAEGSSNTVLRLFDSSGRELAFNDDFSIQTTDSWLQVPVFAGQSYYIGVNGSSANARSYDPMTGNGASAGSQGNYILSINSVSATESSLFLSGIYQDLLHRPPSASELHDRQVEIDAARAQIMSGIAVDYVASVEHRSQLVRADYTTFLGRTPSGAEISFWVQQLQAGQTPEQVVAGFVASTEYFQRQGGTNAGWLDGLYRDLLNRSRDAGSQAFLDELNQQVPLLTVASQITGSVEFHNREIAGAYTTFLGRQPARAELSLWQNLLDQPSGGAGRAAPQEQFVAAVLASGEYFERNGITSRAWVGSLYAQLLGRAPDAAGFQGSVTRLESGFAAERQTIVAALTATGEYQSDLVAQNYHRFLHRSASSSEVALWLPALAGGVTDEQLTAAVLGSAEYFQDAGSSNSAWLDVVYQDVLGRQRDAGSVGFLTGLTNGSLSRTQVAALILASSEYQQDLINSYYHQFLGRQASSDDARAWASVLASGRRDEDVIALILASGEYLERPHQTS